MKEKLLQQIKDLEEIKKTLEPNCRQFCADESIPVKDRWEVFEKATYKKHLCYGGPPNAKDVGLDNEISPYDDWYLDRHQTFDVVERISGWEVDGSYSPDVIDKFKNHYMLQYLGSWEYDW